jgi:3-oxoacyl-(acyl-carrier-protein) synthase
MSVGVAGTGWVTPLGSDIAQVWERLLAGESAAAEVIPSPFGTRDYFAYRVPTCALARLPVHARLRRSSAISRFAAAAGLAALKSAGLELSEKTAERTALVFAISNGGVIYTKRFFHDIVATGAQAASPLLFPETVFNAPASHLAAILGVTGASYTLVGDGAVGLLALKMAEDLMQNDAIDRCLVVGAEEADWLLCDAYRQWRLTRSAPPIEPFGRPARGMILSEGAGAVLISHDSGITIEKIGAAAFSRQNDAHRCVDETFAALDESDGGGVVIASANGTFVDRAEESAIARHFPDASVYSPKAALGEGVAAAAFWQIVCAIQALNTQRLPGVTINPAAQNWRRAIVSTCGLNQQAAALSLRLRD